LKVGELPVVLVGLHWAAVLVGAFPACGKIKTRLQFRVCRRGRDRCDTAWTFQHQTGLIEAEILQGQAP
jgi:hypothetical protein